MRARIGGDNELALPDDELAGATKWLLDAGLTLELERRMLALRGEEPLDADTLCGLTTAVAQDWFGPLAHPPRTYWASQFMLYLPDHVALALPYLLAYLFASRVLAQVDDDEFAARWPQLLLDAETEPTEALAARHLSLDLSSATTWTPVLEAMEAKTLRFETLIGS